MKLKVAHLITMLEMGGAQGNTVYTVKNLDRNKYDPLLISGKGGILDETVISDRRVRTVFSRRLVREIRPLRDFLSFFELRKILRSENPDIVHTHSSKAGILGRLAARAAGVRTIIHTFHGFGFNDRQNRLIRFFYVFLEKIAAVFTDRLIFVSRENLKTAGELGIGNPSKYRLIRSGIKLSDYSHDKDKGRLRKFFAQENSKVVVSLGNLKPQKNPDDFYKIAQDTIHSSSDVYFLYLGGGDRLEEFRKRTEADGLYPRCRFLGWREDSASILSACDFFLLTSLWEGLPRSLVEAMLSGLVPLCYKTDGVLDLVKDGYNGFLFEKGDSVKARETLKKLLEENNFYSEIRSNVLKTDLSEFDIDLMVRQQEALYEETAKELGSR
ncbi:MAG: hypothetical protein COT17_03275 [Elusimicrobia bacterium CG08_land_8_20_14_0_20_51_18]|nr:MAG: hypothetical protein COT17_03275 [Elusimicrobia bacterium CG08_land_8_20_14_0_20_51_18]